MHIHTPYTLNAEIFYRHYSNVTDIITMSNRHSLLGVAETELLFPSQRCSPQEFSILLNYAISITIQACA